MIEVSHGLLYLSNTKFGNKLNKEIVAYLTFIDQLNTEFR